MPLDSSYEQLMRLLSARGLDWLRQRITDLPDPVTADDTSIDALALTARLAPALSGLRGHKSPLEDIAARRLSRQVVCDAADAVLSGSGSGEQRGLVLAGRLVAGDHPLWQLAVLALAQDRDLPLADRLAASQGADPHMLSEAEEVISAPVPEEALTASKVGRFACVLIQLYRFGADRPCFSHARIYGAAHANALRFAEWARRQRHVTAMSQMAFCLRLIDPDHDLSDLMAEVIASQRPDGSFPEKAGFSTRDQGLEEGVRPTLASLAALHMAGWRGWSGTREVAPARPLHGCRDLFAATIRENVEIWFSGQPREDGLRMAAVMTRATGENWFHRGGFQGYSPDAGELQALAAEVFGAAHAARHARDTLNLTAWPADWKNDARLRWLRGATLILKPAESWCDRAGEMLADTDRFDETCLALLACQPVEPAAALVKTARLHARNALAAARRPEELTPAQASAYLGRLCRIAQLFEADPRLQAAA